jgi:hypothetical protein
VSEVLDLDERRRPALISGTIYPVPQLTYDDMNKPTPCCMCGFYRYWFDGEVW